MLFLGIVTTEHPAVQNILSGHDAAILTLVIKWMQLWSDQKSLFANTQNGVN